MPYRPSSRSRPSSSRNMMPRSLPALSSFGPLSLTHHLEHGKVGTIFVDCIRQVSSLWTNFLIWSLNLCVVGSKPEETNEQQHIMDLQVALQRLPKVHLLALEAIIGHIKKCVLQCLAREIDTDSLLVLSIRPLLKRTMKCISPNLHCRWVGVSANSELSSYVLVLTLSRHSTA